MVPTPIRNYATTARGTEASRASSRRNPKDVDRRTIRKGKPGAEGAPDRFTTLTSDITLGILKYLSASDLYHCAQMCRGLAAVTDDDRLWKGIWEGVVLKDPVVKTLYEEPQEGCSHKLLCRPIAVTKGKWKTGEGVTTFTKNPWFSSTEDLGGEKMVISSRYILVASGSIVDVLSATTGKHMHRLRGLVTRHDIPTHTRAVILSKDEEMVAAHAMLHEVCVWKVDTGELLHTFDHHPNPIDRIAMHYHTLVAIGGSGDVFVWCLETGQPLDRFSMPRDGLVYRLTVMDDQLVAVQDFKGFQLRDVEMGTDLLSKRGHEFEHYYKLILVDSDTHSLVGMKADAIYVWDTETGAERGIVRSAQHRSYEGMVVQDGQLIVQCFHTSHSLTAPYSFTTHFAIFVVNLKGNTSVLYSIDDGPQMVHRAIIPGTHRISEYQIAVVSSELVLVSLQNTNFMYLFDVKNRKFVRNVVEGMEDCQIVGFNASFAKLQIVCKTFGTNDIKYLTYDFAA